MNTFLQSVLASKTNRRALLVLAVLAVLVLLYKVAYPLLFQAYVGERSAQLTYENARELTERRVRSAGAIADRAGTLRASGSNGGSGAKSRSGPRSGSGRAEPTGSRGRSRSRS